MSGPILISPADNAQFGPSDLIQFEWQLAPMSGAQAVKIALYIGRDRAKPYADPSGIVKRGVFMPRDAWSRYNETVDKIGLKAGETYYWQVGQELPGSGLILSDVRSIRINEQLQLYVQYPVEVPRGTPFVFRVSLSNVSIAPFRLTFPTSRHFEIAIFQMLYGQSRYVWPPVTAAAQVVTSVEILPRQAYQETFIWNQIDTYGQAVAPGPYYFKIGCMAQEFRREDTRTFIIF